MSYNRFLEMNYSLRARILDQIQSGDRNGFVENLGLLIVLAVCPTKPTTILSTNTSVFTLRAVVKCGQHLTISRRGLPSPGDAQEGQALPWQGELQMGYAVLNRNPGWRGEELQLSGALQLIVLLGGR